MRQRQNVALSPPLADLQREGVSLAARVVGRVAGVGIVIGRTKLCPLDRSLSLSLSRHRVGDALCLLTISQFSPSVSDLVYAFQGYFFYCRQKVSVEDFPVK